MLTTQLNVRMDAEIKPSGDQALAEIGYTPSGVVQAVWRFAARNRHNRQTLLELRRILDPDEHDHSEPRRDWVQEAPHLYERLLQGMGIEGEPAPLPQTNEELLFQAHLDKMAERGMLA